MRRILLSLGLVVAAAVRASGDPASADAEARKDAASLRKAMEAIATKFLTARTEADRLKVIRDAESIDPVPYKDFAPFHKSFLRRVQAVTRKGKGGRETLVTESDKQEWKYRVKFSGVGSPAKPAPMIWYLHGSGGPESSGFWSRGGFIEVYPEAHPVRNTNEYEWINGYTDEFILALNRRIRQEAFVDGNRVFCAGFSAGGFGAWYYGLRHPDLFASIFPMAGGPFYPDTPGPYPHESIFANALHLPISIWHGALDKQVAVAGDRKGADVLDRLGYEVFYKEYPEGDHGDWFGRDSGFIRKKCDEWLLTKKRNPHPKKVVWVSEHITMQQPRPVPSGAYWLRVHSDLEDKNTAFKAQATAEIQGNRVEVKTTGSAKRVTITAHPSLFDLDQPVEIVVNGKEKFKGQISCRLKTLLETFTRYWDAELHYVGEVTVEVR